MRELVQVLDRTARSVAGLIASPQTAEAWERPSALAQMSTGALAAHIVSALARTEVVLDEAEPKVDRIVEIPAYYGLNRLASESELDAGLHRALRIDAERRSQSGPAALARDFFDLVDRLTARLAGTRPERLVPVIQAPGAGAQLDCYLKTRIVELVVHGDDLAVSIGAEWAPATDAAAVVIEVLIGLARARSRDLEIIRVFARHERADRAEIRVF